MCPQSIEAFVFYKTEGKNYSIHSMITRVEVFVHPGLGAELAKVAIAIPAISIPRAKGRIARSSESAILRPEDVPLHTKRLPNEFQNNFGSVISPPRLPNIIPKEIRSGIQ